MGTRERTKMSGRFDKLNREAEDGMTLGDDVGGELVVVFVPLLLLVELDLAAAAFAAAAASAVDDPLTSTLLAINGSF